MRIYGMKVIRLTTGGLTDVRTFFFGSTANNCREKSAEVIVPTHELFWEGLNLIVSEQ